MKVLNLYAGIGGNRKLWGNDDEITAVEFDEQIAKIYQGKGAINQADAAVYVSPRIY